MHALIISPFIQKELQLTFYANETTSTLHCSICSDGEHILKYLKNATFASVYISSRRTNKSDHLACIGRQNQNV